MVILISYLSVFEILYMIIILIRLASRKQKSLFHRPVAGLRVDLMDRCDPLRVKVFICGVPGNAWPRAFI